MDHFSLLLISCPSVYAQFSFLPIFTLPYKPFRTFIFYATMVTTFFRHLHRQLVCRTAAIKKVFFCFLLLVDKFQVAYWIILFLYLNEHGSESEEALLVIIAFIDTNISAGVQEVPLLIDTIYRYIQQGSSSVKNRKYIGYFKCTL